MRHKAWGMSTLIPQLKRQYRSEYTAYSHPMSRLRGLWNRSETAWYWHRRLLDQELDMPQIGTESKNCLVRETYRIASTDLRESVGSLRIRTQSQQFLLMLQRSEFETYKKEEQRRSYHDQLEWGVRNISKKNIQARYCSKKSVRSSTSTEIS